jgi:hypothetical protein
MTWFNTKDLRSTISAMLSVSTAPAPDPARQAEMLEDLRAKMLALAALAPGPRSDLLARRIRYAGSVEPLWYARGELMGLLAKVHGELAAREQLEELGGQFKALLPRGLQSRPSRLDGSYRSSRPGED